MLKYTFWFRIWSMFENIPCKLWENLYSAVIGYIFYNY